MKMSCLLGRPAALAAAALVTVAGTAGSALAQPVNDDCVNALEVGPGTYTGTTATATASEGASASCGNSSGGKDVWYKITPSEDATLVVATCGSGYDTVLSVHTGCPGTTSNEIACNDDACDGTRSRIDVPVSAGVTYYIRVAGWGSASGSYTLTVALQDPPPPGSGPDVVYSGIGNDFSHYGPVGSIRAYTYGTRTCNIGNMDLLWTNGGTPGIGFNLYRLHDGRLMQIGQSWVKVACCAAVSNGCGVCNGRGGNVLGAGCLDVYTSGWNGSHGNLKPRSQVNPWTGTFGPTPPGGSFSAIDRRLQVQTSDLQATNFPGARYFAEGVFVATDEAPEKKMNNASYQEVVVSQSNFALSLRSGTAMEAGKGAIYAWRDHGLGVNQPDESVVVQEVDVPGEGRFVVAHKASDNGDGTWRYEYAVFNLNSHRAGGSFSVPVAPGAVVTNAGFHDVPYHSGEPYDNTDWTISVAEGAVTWSSPQTFAQNENSNALRWGTMYNFWFDADRPPAPAAATLGLFRPGTPEALAVTVDAPAGGGGPACPADWDGDGQVNSNDISAFLGVWLADVQDGTSAADFDGSGSVNSNDISAFLSAWLEAVQEGC